MNTPAQNSGPILKIAYIYIKFPKITETFNLREMLGLEKRGVEVEVFSLLTPDKKAKQHPEAQAFQQKTQYSPWVLSHHVLKAQMHFLLKTPQRYLGVLARVLAGSISQPILLAKTAAIFPKCVYFAHLAEKMKINHIHATFAAHNATCAMIMSALTDIGYSFTSHAYDLFIETALHHQKFHYALFNATISQFNIQHIGKQFGRDFLSKTHLVRCGIDLEQYRPRPIPKGAPPDQTAVILCVASFQKKKGHVFLLEALAILKGHNLPIRCVLVGDGPERESILKKIEQLHIKEMVTLAGSQTQDEVISWLHKADCFALPSIIVGNRMEGIPVVLMEAMACELPVVSTRTSGIPELIENGINGLLVEPEDAPALAAAITRILTDQDFSSRLGKAGREKIKQDFTLDVNVDRIWRLYTDAV